MFGLLCWFALDRILEMPFWVLFGVLFGVVVVDLDSSQSKVGRRLWFVSWWMKHRGVLHSLFSCVLLSLIVGMFDLWLGFGFGVGYVSHLVLDALTLAGVGLFWPLRFRVSGFVRSGSWVEDVLFVLLLGLDIVFGVWIFFN